MSATEFYGGLVKAELARNRSPEVAGEDVRGNKEKEKRDCLDYAILIEIDDLLDVVSEMIAMSNGEKDPPPNRMAVLRKEAAEKIRELL